MITWIAACADPASPSPAPSAAASPAGLSPSPSVTASSPSPQPSPTPAQPTLSDRPFTVLVLGRDWGYRTDAMIVVGVDPTTRRVTYASLPRDTIDVPLPGGGVFKNQKVNAFFVAARSDPRQYPMGPEQAIKDMMGGLLGVRIDYYAMTTFDGFENLANAMGGVTVNVAKGIVDPKYQVTTKDIGIRFKAGPQLMKGSRALIYVRTRGGDNDFERSRRQQTFLSAAGNQLLAHPGLLAALLSARSSFATDLPLDQLAALIEAFGKPLEAPAITGVVLGPRTYSSAADCPCGYALKPNVAAIQKAAARLFPWAVEH